MHLLTRKARRVARVVKIFNSTSGVAIGEGGHWFATDGIGIKFYEIHTQ